MQGSLIQSPADETQSHGPDLEHFKPEPLPVSLWVHQYTLNTQGTPRKEPPQKVWKHFVVLLTDGSMVEGLICIQNV